MFHDSDLIPANHARALPALQAARPAPDCTIAAANDVEAVDRWLYAYRHRSQHTRSCYRKEAVRYLLWLSLIKHETLAAASQETVEAYAAFLAQPDTDWCGPKRPVAHADWKPFSGPLSHKSRTDALSALNNLYTWLQDSGYLTRNPFRLIKGKQADNVSLRNRQAAARQRVFYDDEWQLILETVELFPRNTQLQTVGYYRAKFLLTFFYCTGIRTSELVSLDMSGFTRRNGQWWCHITGKGGLERDVPCNGRTMTALRDYRLSLGLSRAPVPGDDSALLYALTHKRTPITSRYGIYKAVKGIFEKAAAQAEGESRDKLLQASTHWIRHTSATHAHAKGIDTKTRQTVLGHSNPATTDIYTHLEDGAIHEAYEKL